MLVKFCLFHIRNAHPNDLDMVLLGGGQDAVDAAEVFFRPFGRGKFQVFFAFREVPRVIRTEEDDQKADIGLLFKRLLDGVRPVEKLGIGQSGALFA